MYIYMSSYPSRSLSLSPLCFLSRSLSFPLSISLSLYVSLSPSPFSFLCLSLTLFLARSFSLSQPILQGLWLLHLNSWF